jgi:hypothetical protein
MFGRKVMAKLQKHTLRGNGVKTHIDMDRPDFPGNDYDIMCSAHVTRYKRNTGAAHKSRSLILK